MEQVTLSWSIKNLITVNLMVVVFGAALALAVQGARAAKNNVVAFPARNAG